MPYSVFELFKVGIGPSSSHTVGPMVAARSFINLVAKQGKLVSVRRIEARLYGSLAFTGVGHGSDNAILLGLSGETPNSIKPDQVAGIISDIEKMKTIKLAGGHQIKFNRETDLIFDYGKPLLGHSNGMRFFAIDLDGKVIFDEIYYSVGGGFIATEDELKDQKVTRELMPGAPYGFKSSVQMLEMGNTSGLTISEMVLANEMSQQSKQKILAKIDNIWTVMHSCMERGLIGEGNLPGGGKCTPAGQADP